MFSGNIGVVLLAALIAVAPVAQAYECDVVSKEHTTNYGEFTIAFAADSVAAGRRGLELL